MKRAHPEAAAIWKLEPQQRGAPHYHLLLFGIEFIPHQVIARWWYEVVGSGDKRHHLVAGISIEAVKSRAGDVLRLQALHGQGDRSAAASSSRVWGFTRARRRPLLFQIKPAGRFPSMR